MNITDLSWPESRSKSKARVPSGQSGWEGNSERGAEDLARAVRLPITRFRLAAMLACAITALLLGGCTFSYVKEFNEAAYTLPAEPLPMQPKSLSDLLNAPEILAIHYDRYPNAAVFYASPSQPEHLRQFLAELKAKAVNPLPAVKDQFLFAIRNSFKIHNVRVIEEPRFSKTVTDPHASYWSVHKTTRNTEDELNQLKKTFREGMAIDFYTHKWWFIPYPEDEEHYRLVYSVEARLIRIEESAVLWKGVCNIVEQHPPAQRLTLAELKSDDIARKDRIARAAEECTADLIFQFSGKRNY
jgi:hypothetical protein